MLVLFLDTVAKKTELAGANEKKVALPVVSSSLSSKPTFSLTLFQKEQIGKLFKSYIFKGWIPSLKDIQNKLTAHNLTIDKSLANIRTWVKAEIERNKKIKGGKVERSQWSSRQIKRLREHFLKYYKFTKQRRKATFPSQSEYMDALSTIEEFRGKNIEFLRGKLRYEFKLLLSESGGREANNIRAAMGDTSNSRWNIFQKKKVREYFKNYYFITKITKIPKYPSGREIYEATKKLSALKDKSVSHVRNMLYLELKRLVKTKTQSKLKRGKSLDFGLKSMHFRDVLSTKLYLRRCTHYLTLNMVGSYDNPWILDYNSSRPKADAWSQIEKNVMRAHFRHFYEIAMKLHAPIYPFRFEVQMAVQTIRELGRKSPNQVRDRLQNELTLLMQYLKT